MGMAMWRRSAPGPRPTERPRSCGGRTPTRTCWSSAGAQETKLRALRLAEIGGYLGAAIGSLVNLFDPEVVLVGGGFGEAAGELVLGPAEDAARREALEPADASASRRARRARGRGGSRRSRAGRLRRARRNLVSRAAGGLRHADRQPRRCHAPGSRRAARGGSRPLRGHAPLPHPARASRDRCTASELSPPQRGGADGRGRVPTGAGRAGGARVRCGPARGQRPGCAAGRGGVVRRTARHRVAGAVGCRDGTRREWARRRSLPVPRVSPPTRG